MAALVSDLSPELRLAVSHAPASTRDRYAALFALDRQLGSALIGRSEPLAAQLRLAWWRDSLGEMSRASGPPLVRELARVWGGQGAVLIALVDGWEEVAVGEAGFAAAADRMGEARALGCAAAAGQPPSQECATAARRWTLVALAPMAVDDRQRAAMLGLARELPRAPLPRALRPLAILDGLARRAAARGGGALLGDRLSPLAALRLGIFGR